MKRLTIPGSGTESRATKPARVSAPATLGGAAFGASREDTGADLLEAAQAAEIEQQATLEAAPVEQSYPETLALYVQAKQGPAQNSEFKARQLPPRHRPQRPELALADLGVTPDVVACQVDVTPPERREMRQQAVIHRPSMAA